MAEKHTTVPYQYSAVLEHYRRVDDTSKLQAKSYARVRGSLHPEPYDMQTALALALDQLKTYTDAGWYIVRLHVKAYDAPAEGVGGLA